MILYIHTQGEQTWGQVGTKVRNRGHCRKITVVPLQTMGGAGGTALPNTGTFLTLDHPTIIIRQQPQLRSYNESKLRRGDTFSCRHSTRIRWQIFTGKEVIYFLRE